MSILVYFSQENYTFIGANIISVNSLLMRQSAVKKGEKESKNEDETTLKDDEIEDSLLEHENWQDVPI